MSGDNLSYLSPKIRQPKGSGMSLGTFEKLQEHFRRRLRLAEELGRKPDLPMAMHEAGQSFAYEYHDVRVDHCALQSRSVDDTLIQCAATIGTSDTVEIAEHDLWVEVVCIMAGAAAQHSVDSLSACDNAVRDVQRAAEFIELTGLSSEQADELIVAASKAAAKIMAENIGTVRKIAEVLERKKRMEGYEIRRIIRQHKQAAHS
jgi:hypothetical protein